jgi:hypothetical protein
MKIKGKIEYKDIGMGTWVLVSDTGETYQLYEPSSELCQSGLSVEVNGKIRNDLMGFAMVGSFFEVEFFEIKP